MYSKCHNYSALIIPLSGNSKDFPFFLMRGLFDSQKNDSPSLAVLLDPKPFFQWRLAHLSHAARAGLRTCLAIRPARGTRGMGRSREFRKIGDDSLGKMQVRYIIYATPHKYMTCPTTTITEISRSSKGSFFKKNFPLIFYLS